MNLYVREKTADNSSINCKYTKAKLHLAHDSALDINSAFIKAIGLLRNGRKYSPKDPISSSIEGDRVAQLFFDKCFKT